jgi:tRNA(Ile)-lysidine synthetase-like protein
VLTPSQFAHSKSQTAFGKMATTVIDFWKANPSFWIATGAKQREADEFIRDNFWCFDRTSQNLVGTIIYLDQFSRHFQRVGLLLEEHVLDYRLAAVDLVHLRLEELKTMDETEIVFALMPFKHTGRFDFIFEYLHKTWLPWHNKTIIELPLLQKFYIDTYKKAFTLDTVRWSLINVHDEEAAYDAAAICDYHPPRYVRDSWELGLLTTCKEIEALKTMIPKDGPVIVSLSGGVDSMVMLALLAHCGVKVHAVHIIYGNRVQSEDEYRFLAKFCQRLSVPLWVYRIKWLRRGEVDRQFYEDITRDLRFMTYKAVGQLLGEAPRVLLGHIKDDVVENIWTNIAHCHHLENLKKMEAEEVQHGVQIQRPFLGVDKTEIYAVSAQWAIPFLKNTTPSWSNRGKFREQFHAATVEQFGPGIDEKLIEFAETMRAQSVLLNKLLYDPIYESFADNTVDITTAVKARLDAGGWLTIFEHVCHTRLGVARPSIKCVRDFSERLGRWTSCDSGRLGPTLRAEMGKEFHILVSGVVGGGKYSMKFVVA